MEVARAQDDGKDFNSWRTMAEDNRKALYEIGLWGVPSFSIVDNKTDSRKSLQSYWGQDRLFAIESYYREALKQTKQEQQLASS